MTLTVREIANPELSVWRSRLLTPMLVLVPLLLGCGRFTYCYSPVTVTSAEVEGHAAALVPIPTDGATGELRIASLGVGVVTPPSRGPSFRALFVRFVLVNESVESWTFNAAEQRIEVLDGRERIIIWSRSETGAPPSAVPVPAHDATSLDVLFPIGSRDEGDLERFDVHWTVRQQARLVTGRAEFSRHLVEPVPAPAAFRPDEPPPYRIRPPFDPPAPCLP
jgi:hypothetical protein